MEVAISSPTMAFDFVDNVVKVRIIKKVVLLGTLYVIQLAFSCCWLKMLCVIVLPSGKGFTFAPLVLQHLRNTRNKK